MAYVQNPLLPQTLTLKLKGLATQANQFSEAPDGSLAKADNVWISKDSVAEPRRGFTFLPYSLPHSADIADKFGEFQNTLLIHYNNTATTNNNDSLAYYSNSTGVYSFTNVPAGTYQIVADLNEATGTYTSAGYSFRTPVVVTMDALGDNLVDVNFTPVALSATNPTPPGAR